jgi:hypothetical protein
MDQLFTSQPAEGSNALAQFNADQIGYETAVDDKLKGGNANHLLSGLSLLEDVQREDYFNPKGTLLLTGMSNLLCSINRERRMPLFI